MNKKVLKTMIILVVVYLFVWYILKFAIPEKFVLNINNAKLIKAGQYIDSHLWLYYITGIISSFITYWLYLCAVTKSSKLGWKKCLLILVVIGGNIGINFLSLTLSTYYSILAMIILPTIFKSDLRTTANVFTIHFLSQWLSLEIRGLTKYMLSFDSLSLTFMTIECYFWLILLYLYNYYNNEV